MTDKNQKILVHTCCAACAGHVYSQLEKAGFEVTGFFYHPEIDDQDEYAKRRDDLLKYAKETGVKLIESIYDTSDFGNLVDPFKDHDSIKYINDKDRYRRRRCQICNALVIQKTIEQAKKLKLKFFTTSLLCSPYKDHEQIVELCNEKALDYNVSFYYQDFRKGYWMGRNYARNHDIYIPRFCGCSESEKEKILE